MFANANLKGHISISTCDLVVIQALWINAIVAFYLIAELEG